MTSYPAGSPSSRAGAHAPDIDHVAHVLGAAVNVAMDRFAHDHQALAQRLHWPLEMVNKNAAHAREMVRLDLARHAVVQHITRQAAPAPPARGNPPNGWDRLQSAAQQEFDRETFAATHPIKALANHIHDQRITRSGERHLARANDLIGGGVAGAIADFGEGLGKASDLQRRYIQGGVVSDAVNRRFELPAPPSAADQAATMVAPLRREAGLRPPRTFAGRLAAGAPRMAAVVLAPEVAAPLVLGTQGLGAANARARETHAPDTPLNDAAIAATAGIDTLAGLLLRGRKGLDPARVIERLPEAARSDALELSAKVFAKSAAGATVGGAQSTADNLIAARSYDHTRRWNGGLAEGATLGAVTAPFGGIGHNSGARPRAGPSASVPLRSFTQYEIVSEHPVSGSSRPWHRTQANRSFHSQLSAYGDFATAMNDVFGAHVSNDMKSGFGKALINPPGAVWHHPVDRPGVVQLLRKTEHTDPRLQHVLHPGLRREGGHAQLRNAATSAGPLGGDRRDGWD